MTAARASKGKLRDAASDQQAAVGALMRELEGYARAHGGRFNVFGSAARGEMRAGSDLDLLVDFAPDEQASAVAYAESRARARGLTPDILEPAYAGRAVLAHVELDQEGRMTTERRSALVLGSASSALRHFAAAIALFDEGGFDEPGAEGYRRTMAFLHAMQAGHSSLENALGRLLPPSAHEEAGGSGWHAELILRAAAQGILPSDVAEAAQATRRFRHVAMHSYDFVFDPGRAALPVEAARLIVDRLMPLLTAAADRLAE